MRQRSSQVFGRAAHLGRAEVLGADADDDLALELAAGDHAGLSQARLALPVDWHARVSERLLGKHPANISSAVSGTIRT